MEIIQIFLKLDGLFKAKGKVLAKTILFIYSLDSWKKLIKNRSGGNIGFRCSYIYVVVIDASGVIYCSCKRRKIYKGSSVLHSRIWGCHATLPRKQQLLTLEPPSFSIVFQSRIDY